MSAQSRHPWTTPTPKSAYSPGAPWPCFCCSSGASGDCSCAKDDDATPRSAKGVQLRCELKFIEKSIFAHLWLAAPMSEMEGFMGRSFRSRLSRDSLLEFMARHGLIIVCPLPCRRKVIEECFSNYSVEHILGALVRGGERSLLIHLQISVHRSDTQSALFLNE